MKQKNTYNISDLEEIMKKLLSPKGCPWDKEQTHQSLAPYAIEEAFELAEAIENKNNDAIKEELGDFLFQVIFHCALASKAKKFTLSDVIKTICKKLTYRHPHVFSNKKVKTSDEVLKNWEKLKALEKNQKDKYADIFNIPASLPALQRAQKIGDKTKRLNFDWTHPDEVFDKVIEEINELKSAYVTQDKSQIEEELGDVFFVLAQLARHLKFEAETVARKGNKKFENRFIKLMKLAEKQKLDFIKLPTTTKEQLWQQIKRKD
ncbi:MAG: nucleoside triphosphate pyrophosphohydrolase [Oligoflexia bacterium]|nr:nucleoside triphosphate pyrophosphohydrolase [Oligoflexia bacterium]